MIGPAAIILLHENGNVGLAKTIRFQLIDGAFCFLVRPVNTKYCCILSRHFFPPGF